MNPGIRSIFTYILYFYVSFLKTENIYMGITATNVSKKYGEQLALNNVTFTINTGDVVGFIGPNGAGKSTMMKIICGYITQSEGNVEIDGININDQPVSIRKDIGYLPEHNPLYLDMYVKEYLKYVAGIYRIKNKKERITEIIHKTGLEREQHKKIGALSKGYRQRVGLAQAMIHDPKVLILDEPTSGLDPNQIIEIRNLISEAGRERTVMLSTHIMQEVEAICDRILIIDKGKIVADDKTKTIIQKSDQKEQNIIVEFDPDPAYEKIMKLPGVFKAVKVKNNRWILQSNNKEDIRGDIFTFAVDNNLKVLTIQVQEKSLEDIFHELTREKE
jgi:ABC-2 type transport system ATP-binding protein